MQLKSQRYIVSTDFVFNWKISFTFHLFIHLLTCIFISHILHNMAYIKIHRGTQ
jgi:hypothetical protein